MKTVLLKLLLFIASMFVSTSYAVVSNEDMYYSIEKSWIDIPSEDFVLNIVRDRKLNELVKQYHQVEKRKLENFHTRIDLLDNISQYIEDYLENIEKKLLLSNFNKMVKRKSWYLKKVSELYSFPREDLVSVFYKTNHDGKNILYLRNSIEFDLKLPTYWGMFALEMLDPCKRMLTPQYYKWLNYYAKDYPHFFAWLEGEELTFRTPQTKLLNSEEIENCRVKFSDGLMYYSHSNKLVTTENNHEYIYILTVSGEIYITRSSDSIKHTSLSSGAPILGAGSIKVNNGQIRYISNESGHYRPEAPILQEVLKLLTKLHKVNISDIDVNYYSDHNLIDKKAKDFFSKKLSETKISNINLLYNFKY